MEPVDDRCQDLGYEAGLIHPAGLSDDDLPTQSVFPHADQPVQFVVPEERGVRPFMQEMEAEVYEEIGVAEGSGLNIQYSTSFGSCPDRSHCCAGGDRGVSQSPMRLDDDTVSGVIELKRVGVGFQKSRPVLMRGVPKLMEDLVDGRKVFVMDQQIEIVHMPNCVIPIQLGREYWSADGNARDASCLACFQDPLELMRED